MKKLVFIGLIMCGFTTVMGQSREIASGDSIPWELRKQSFIYTAAMGFNDPVVAKMAIYNLLAENPQNTALYDSLALMYYEYNQNVSAALVAQQSLQFNANNMFATQIAAESLDKVGAKDKALGYYEKLYLDNSNIGTLYKMSFLQMELSRFAEASTSLDIIIGDPTAKESSIVFPTVDQQGQEVPLDVAAHRVKAMIEEAKGNVEVAKQKYLDVLKMKPDFQVVQQQIQELTKATKEGN